MASQSSAKRHHYMVTCLLVFVHNNNPGQRFMNVVTSQENRFVPASALAEVRNSIVLRGNQEMGLEISEIRDVVVMSVSYLGYMTEKTFQDLPAHAPMADPNAPGPTIN